MDTKLHAILGQLHSLLSSADAEDFTRASTARHMSPFLRAALRSLAKERRHGRDGKRLLRDIRSARTQESGSRVADLTKDRPLKGNGKESQFLALLKGCSHLSDKEALRRFVESIQLGVKVSAKDGLPRAMSKVARAIAVAPEETRQKTMDALAAGPDSQTQGWVNVIRKSR
jgi:hypothetical protein